MKFPSGRNRSGPHGDSQWADWSTSGPRSETSMGNEEVLPRRWPRSTSACRTSIGIRSVPTGGRWSPIEPLAVPLSLMLFGITTAGGMFVVPLYAFLTTRCAEDAASRTIAANNILNSLGMVIGSAVATGLSAMGVPVVDQVLLVAAMSAFSAWLGWLLFKAEKEAAGTRDRNTIR